MFRSVAGERAYTDSGFIAARKAVALDPELADGWFALGDLESIVLKLSDARRAYLKALELRPEPRRRHGRPGQRLRRARPLR